MVFKHDMKLIAILFKLFFYSLILQFYFFYVYNSNLQKSSTCEFIPYLKIQKNRNIKMLLIHKGKNKIEINSHM
jgi:hypothetical protein